MAPRIIEWLRDSWKISASLHIARPSFVLDVPVYCRPCPAEVSCLKTGAVAVTETCVEF